MRRPLHCLLIGVLTFSLSTDAARACGHLRRACRVPCCPPPVCVPVAACGIDPCGSWMVVTVPYAVPDAASWVTTASGCCGGEEIAADVAPVVISESAVVSGAESVVESPVEPAPPSVAEPVAPPESVVAAVPAAERALSIPAVESATPAEPRVPDLQPAPEPDAPAVKPASNDEPALEPVPPTPDREEEPNGVPQPPAEPAVPREENLFEKVERRVGEPTSSDADNPAAESAAVAESDADAPAAGDAPAAAPVAEAVEPSAAPADEAAPPAAEGLPQEPASPEADATEPAAPPAESAADPADAASREPLRRWIDASGSYAVVGELVAVGADRVAIRRNDGREISVPLEKLSAHDRTYARGAGERLAAQRQAAPASGDTAGL